MSVAPTEKGEIYDFIQSHGITGFATVAGDRHSFWAGLAAKSLPPRPFEPVGVAFVTGSISAPGMIEALEHRRKSDVRVTRWIWAAKFDAGRLLTARRIARNPYQGRTVDLCPTNINRGFITRN